MLAPRRQRQSGGAASRDGERQANHDLRAAFAPATDHDLAAMELDDLLGGREAKAGAESARAEKRLEYPRQDIGRDAGPAPYVN
jgi:hypothetical protein